MHKARVSALRKLMAQKGFAGFLIPMSDEFQNEYVPENAKRMEWISGFSGSAGTAVVLSKKAAVFVDGRYTVQAKQQVNSKLFEIHNIKDISITDWLKKNCKKGDVIAYDPWLHTEANRERLIRAATEIHFKSSQNLVDEIWKDRPKPPCGQVAVHPLKYAGEKHASKIKNIVREIKANGAAATLITTPDSLCWLLNIRGSDISQTPFALAHALIHENGKVGLYIDKGKVTAPVKKHLGSNITINEPSFLIDHIDALARKRAKIHLDPNLSPAIFFDVISSAKGLVVRKPDPCQLPKACKNKVEIEGMVNAHIRDGAAVTSFLCWLDENAGGGNLTEISIAEKLLEFRKKQKLFMEPSFNTIAGFAEHGAIVHYRADQKSNSRIKPGNILLLDSGGQYLDGTTDITRTIVIGTPTKEQKENFTRVLKGHIAVASFKFPEGTSGGEIDAVARQYLWKAGLDYDHGTGHGVGSYLSVHEGPQRISRTSNVPLHEGMVISNEPGYYKEGEYGIRIENLVVVRKDKKLSSKKNYYCFETITKVPIDIRLVEKSMLTNDEIDWLNTYHATIINDLKRHLDKKTHQWLVSSTIL